MNKKTWSAPIALIVVLVAALVFGGITVSADTTGTCGAEGDNLTWSLDSEGVLTISGTGAMAEYEGHAPWYSERAKIKSVVVGNGVTTIGWNAFNGYDNLEIVTLGSSVETIGTYAFKDCAKLTTVSFPNSLKGIGFHAFDNSGLTSLSLPSGIEGIGECAFLHCDGLTSLDFTFDEDVSFGRGAFEACSNLTSVTLKGNLKNVGYSMFNDCESLAAVTLPDSVEYIYDYAFNDCTSLTSFAIPAGVKTIYREAFSGSGITSITIPATLNDEYENAFSSCLDLTTVTFADGVTSIPEYAFYGCQSLTTVNIPSSVTSIGDYAFAETGLESVTLLPTVTYMGERVYSGCEKLTTVTILDGVTEIATGTFGNCTALETISFPASVTTIGVSAFSGAGLTSLELPSTITKIDNGAFSYTKLTSVEISATVNYGTAVFIACEDLRSATIADGVTLINDYTFMDCTSLKSIALPSSVNTIGEYAFAFTALTSFTVPSTVDSIGMYAFYECDDLATVTFDDKDTPLYIGRKAFSYSGLESIVIPGFVRYTDYDNTTYAGIGEELFASCYKLKSVEILEGVEYIGFHAFDYCTALETVIIPGSIEYIDDDAFRYCCHVTDVYCYADPTFTWEEDGDDFIIDTHSTTRFHVEGPASAFESAYPDANVVFVGSSNLDAFVVGHSITLSADIGVNFFIRLPEGYDRSNTEVTFTWGLGDRANTAKGKLVSINQYGANYKVTCGVSACEMGDEITMVVKSGETELISDKYSVIEYINILATYQYYSQEELQDLLAAMVFYGYSAQSYFNYRKDNRIDWYNEVSSVNRGHVYDFCDALYITPPLPDPAWMTIKNIENDDLGIKFYAASVLCSSQTKVRLYFEVTDQAKFANLTASYNSKSLSFKTRTIGGKDLVYIETPGLAAGAIEEAITVKIGGKDYSYDYRYYLLQCLTNISYESFADTACYLYAVSHYAKIYQEGLTNG